VINYLVFILLMTQYNDLRWIEHFYVNKNLVHHLTKKLKPFMEKKNMKFKANVLVSICVAYSLYKLVHAFEYLHCFELFVIEKSIIHLVSHEFLYFVLNNQIEWLKGNAFNEVMDGFMTYVACRQSMAP